MRLSLPPCNIPFLPVDHLKWQPLKPLLIKVKSVLQQFNELSDEAEGVLFSFLSLLELQASIETQHVKLGLSEIAIQRFQKTLLSQSSDFKILENCQSTLNWEIQIGFKKKLSPHYLRQIHKKIKQGLEKSQSDIGRYRKDQNWIGPKGCPLEEAYFYPPPPREVSRYMNNLEQFIQYSDQEPLIKLAIYFAQLLIIHPFMDGNGRVARMVIPHFLYQNQISSTPLFYMSCFFKRHRLEYFERLYEITAHGNWEGWIRFFLKGMIEEGKLHLKRIKAILECLESFHKIAGSTPSAQSVIQAFFASPILNSQDLKDNLETRRVLRKLKGAKLIAPYWKNRTYWEISKWRDLLS